MLVEFPFVVKVNFFKYEIREYKIYYFQLTAAESRALNKPCIMWHFDVHDLWHLLSALAIFCTLEAAESLDTIHSRDIPNLLITGESKFIF